MKPQNILIGARIVKVDIYNHSCGLVLLSSKCCYWTFPVVQTCLGFGCQNIRTRCGNIYKWNTGFVLFRHVLKIPHWIGECLFSRKKIYIFWPSVSQYTLNFLCKYLISCLFSYAALVSQGQCLATLRVCGLSKVYISVYKCIRMIIVRNKSFASSEWFLPSSELLPAFWHL